MYQRQRKLLGILAICGGLALTGIGTGVASAAPPPPPPACGQPGNPCPPPPPPPH